MTLSTLVLRFSFPGPIFQARPLGRPTRVSDPMSDFNRGFSSIPAGRADMAVDAGLRSFMLGVYNKVGLGLVVSAALAYATSAVPAVRDLLYVTTPDGRLAGITVLGMAVSFAPLVAVLIGMFAMRNPSPRSASIYYWTIVALIGAGLGYWG